MDIAQPTTMVYPGFFTVSTQLIVDRWFGDNATVAFGGVQVNMDLSDNIEIYSDPKKIEAQDPIATVQTLLSGLNGQVLELFFSNQSHTGTGITTEKIFNKALEQKLEFHLLHAQNLKPLDRLFVNPELQNHIFDLIETGHTVLIPESEIQIGDWTGIGYAVTSLKTGSIQYFVSQLNIENNRWQTALRVNDISQSLSAIELLQTPHTSMRFPTIYAELKQCGNNIITNHNITELGFKVSNLLKQTNNEKTHYHQAFHPAIEAIIFEHVSIVDNWIKT